MAAESAVSFALDKLGEILAAEASLLIGVRREVKWLKEQLGWMKSFLKDAYNKRRKGDERAKHWVREVRDTAYRVEDIIESYMMEIASHRQQPTRCCQIFKSIERYAHELKPRHNLGVEMKELKAKIHEISENRKIYGLEDLGESTPNSTVDAVIQERRIISPLYGDTVTVGFQDHKQKIVEELLDAKVTRRCVKSIVGMGGLGKTTLAKMIFNTNELTVTFKTRAWVSVSQDYTLVDLLKTLIRQVTNCEPTALVESDLKANLYQLLKGKRYFIVLDDIWTATVWNMLKDVLPNDLNGSRVLLTTRMTEVAQYADSSIKPYHLPGLNEKDSWELFLKTAFPANYHVKEKIPIGLQEIAQRLVKRCEGLPLALVVLGGLMSTRATNVEEWMKVEEGVDWGSTEYGKQCLEILALSYDGIVNPNMRSCFLYMGIFPKHSKILASQLIQLWIAEGFITQMENHEMEETARDYLDQLAQRCMIQVTRRWDKSMKGCQIHDLMRDLLLREAKQDGFLNVCNTNTDLGNMGIDRNPIRLAIHISGKVEECSPLPYLRSLSIYDASEVTSEIFRGWKKLRVLHLERVKQSGLRNLLTEKKTANHLRYLGLKDCDWLTELPPSIGDVFANLQTLDVRSTKVREY